MTDGEQAGRVTDGEQPGRVTDAEQAERRRLAMLLHDGPQQLLTSIGLTLDAAIDALRSGTPAEVRRLVGIARSRNRQAASDLRHLGTAVEPAALRQHGLAAALAPLTRSLTEAHDVRFDVDLAGADRLDQAERTLVYQIVREALANAINHARPRRIGIHSHDIPSGGLAITISDDGSGMRRLQSADGLGQGTDSMRERSAELGGSIEWVTSTHQGTSVRLCVPPSGCQSIAA